MDVQARKSKCKIRNWGNQVVPSLLNNLAGKITWLLSFVLFFNLSLLEGYLLNFCWCNLLRVFRVQLLHHKIPHQISGSGVRVKFVGPKLTAAVLRGALMAAFPICRIQVGGVWSVCVCPTFLSPSVGRLVWGTGVLWLHLWFSTPTPPLHRANDLIGHRHNLLHFLSKKNSEEPNYVVNWPEDVLENIILA